MYRTNSHRKIKYRLKKDLGADSGSQNQKEKNFKNTLSGANNIHCNVFSA
jgi:hypothetical protein